MDYKKKYKEALEELKQCDRYDIEPAKTILKIFPELEESDYVIKQRLKHLLGYFRSRGIDHNLCDRILNWLEKQGEQKPVDKVEPKFKVGDWVVYNDTNVYQVKEIDYTNIIPRYELENIDRDKLSIPFTSDYNLRNWTIEDAKDGDVLYSHDKNLLWIYKNITTYYVSMILDYVKYNCISINCDIIIPLDTCPATKEQRETLFKAMHKAGYKWDDNKKELKKIEKNPTWSEEDEKIMKQIDSLLYCQCTIHSSMYEKLHNWLKSLEPQPQWKPTVDQMQSLYSVVITYSKKDDYKLTYDSLNSLYDDLKKL